MLSVSVTPVTAAASSNSNNRRRPNPPVILPDQLLRIELVRPLITPRHPRPVMQQLRKRLRHPVRYRLHHDRPVIILLGLQLLRKLIRPVNPYHKSSDVIRPHSRRSHIIR